MMADAGADPEQPFTTGVFSPIARRYNFSDALTPVLRLTLNFAANAKSFEKSYPEARKELGALRRTIKKLDSQLDTLGLETRFLVERASACQKLKSNVDLLQSGGFKSLREMSLTSFKTITQTNREGLSLIEELSEVSAKLDCYLETAERVARGQSGRPADANLELFLFAAYQAYVNGTGAPFTLDWHIDDAPLSEAARFCVDVVSVAFADVSSAQIRSVSRRVREKSIPVSNMQNASIFLESFNKRDR